MNQSSTLINRRDLLLAGTGLAGSLLMPGGLRQMVDAADNSAVSKPPIDRHALVTRHNPHIQQLDPFAALSVGNGNFAITADVTGLQTFTDDYDKEFPLCTAAHWAWHSIPEPADLKPQTYRYKQYDTYGRQVSYPTDSKGQKPLYDWLRENPHRLHLGRIALALKNPDGSFATSRDITAIDQTLDLWTGIITSRFSFSGEPVLVRTCCHPDHDALAIQIESRLVSQSALSLQIAFPYGSSEVNMADWNSPAKHQTILKISEHRADFSRNLDQDHYSVAITWNDGKLEQAAAHTFLLHGNGNVLESVIAFSPAQTIGEIPAVGATFIASTSRWKDFWTSGGAIDLSQSTDSRANELERRIVLSQYNTALHCAGTMPPPETGLLFNSWYGKSHLEMHWWHGIHFAAWGRLPLLERSLDYYHRILPKAQAIARRQGYDGARWPKMVDAEGNESPSPIAPLLTWLQPHPVYYAELCYRQNPTSATLERWSEIVFESARFMASYAVLDHNRYVLGPPMKTVPENNDTTATRNPTYELAYWRFGLNVAQLWLQRLGKPADPKWADVAARLSPLPVQDGLYLMQEGLTDTYAQWNWEHPSLLGAYGAQPGDGVDIPTMRRTLKKVMEVWDWDRCWGWDFPMAALAAAKLGEGELAVKALMIESVKNRYLPNGHVYQRPNLTAYLPANGGLLAASAMMALSPNGFPNDGKWSVKHEGLRGLL